MNYNDEINDCDKFINSNIIGISTEILESLPVYLIFYNSLFPNSSFR